MKQILYFEQKIIAEGQRLMVSALCCKNLNNHKKVTCIFVANFVIFLTTCSTVKNDDSSVLNKVYNAC